MGLSVDHFISQGTDTDPQASVLATLSSFMPCVYYPVDDHRPTDRTGTGIMLPALWLFRIKKETHCSLLLLFPVHNQAGPVNSAHVAAPTVAELPL